MSTAVATTAEEFVRPPAALDTTAAAAYLGGLGVSTLKKWRVSGDGPRYVKFGAKVVYRVEDLDAFLTEHRIGGDR